MYICVCVCVCVCVCELRSNKSEVLVFKRTDTKTTG